MMRSLSVLLCGGALVLVGCEGCERIEQPGNSQAAPGNVTRHEPSPEITPNKVVPNSPKEAPTDREPVVQPPDGESSSSPQNPLSVETAPAPTPLANLAIPDLTAKLSDPGQRTLAAEELSRRGEAALPALNAALKHQEAAVRAAAIFALGRMGREAASTEAAVADLAEKDPDETVRDAARFALDAIRGQ